MDNRNILHSKINRQRALIKNAISASEKIVKKEICEKIKHRPPTIEERILSLPNYSRLNNLKRKT